MRLPVRAMIAVTTVAALAACSSSASNGPPTSTAPKSTDAPTTSSNDPSSPAGPSGDLYVSIGDSYAAGYQPTSADHGHATTHGFAYQLVGDAQAKGYQLKLVNFGCAGATTASALKQRGCASHVLGPGAKPYTQTQAAAAEGYLRAHRGQVALITVSLGGNDITKCGAAANAVACLAKALKVVKANLHALLTGLRHAAGPQTKIVGTTYPDVFLGEELSSKQADVRLAKLSVVGFQSLINPTLKAAYASVGGSFADVTAATGAYTPLTKTTTLAPYGRIPVAVAQVCRLTYFCQYRDIHPRTAGYAIIARLVAGELPQR